VTTHKVLKKANCKKILSVLVFTMALPFLISCASDEKAQNQESSSVPSQSNTESPSPTSKPSDNKKPGKKAPNKSEVLEETVEEASEEETGETISCVWNVAPKISGELYLSGGSILANSRIGAQPGFDRFVLEFVSGGPVPGSYRVEWVFNDAGGGNVNVTDELHLETSVQGNTALQIVIAGSHEDVPNNEVIYEGPDVLSSTLLGNIVEAKFGGSHAGIILWGIGAEEANGFRVLELSDPPRVVIDVCVSDTSDKLANCLSAYETETFPEWVSTEYLSSYCESSFSTS
tara:strand:+ start:1113 stop:1979 length:867 start_codon:yes stop_codon:yes gene_type:complete